MKPIAAVSIMHNNGDGTDVLVNTVVEREIRRQRLNYERKMKKLAEAIELRDKVDVERHKLLGQKLCEYQQRLHPQRSFLRSVKECCIFALVGVVAIGQYLIGR